MKKELGLIFIFGFIPLLWFKDGKLAFGHDMSFPLSPVDFYLDRLFTWTDRIGSFGSNQTDAIAGILIHGIEVIPSFLGLPLINTQQISFIFWFLLPGITMYILLKNLYPTTGDYPIRISGSLFYMFNHYLLQAWLIAERTKFSVVAAQPLIVLLIINAIYYKKSLLRSSILISLTLFVLSGGSGIPLLGGLFITSVTTLICVFIFAPYGVLEKLRRIAYFVLLSLFLTITLNAYWAYPYIRSFSQNYTQRVEAAGGVNAAVGWSQAISKDASFINILRLQGIPDWYENLDHPYSNNFIKNPLLIALSLIFPIVAFLGFLKNNLQTQPEVIFKTIFLIIVLVGLPFVAGSHPPTGIIYDFALGNLPGFVIFRTPFYKFGMIIWFGFAILVAVGLKNIIDWLNKASFNLPKVLIAPSITGLFIILLFVYNYPFFTGSFFNWSKNYSTMVKIPDYIFEAKKELEIDRFSDRVLFVPDLDNRTQHISYSWSYFSLATIPNMLTRRSAVTNDAATIISERDLINGVYYELRNKGESRLFKYTGASRVVITDDFSVPLDLNYQYEDIKKKVRDSKYFIADKKIGQWEFLNWTEGTNPLIYPSVNNSYLFINSNNLGLITDLPGNDWSEDSFILNNIDDVHEGDYLIINKYIIEALCMNCDGRAIKLISVSPPKILPGSRLYFLSEIIDNYKKSQRKTHPELVEFFLTDMVKQMKALEILMQKEKNSEIVNRITERLKVDLQEIEVNYLAIEDRDRKKDISINIYTNIWNVILSNRAWQERESNFKNRQQLAMLEDLFRNFIEKYPLEPSEFITGNIKRYKINVPKSGDYKLNVFADPRSNYSFLLENKPIKLIKLGKWFQSDSLKFNKGEYFIDVPEAAQEKKSFEPFNLEAAPGRTACHKVRIDIDQPYTYKLTANYQGDSKVSVSFTEENNRFKFDQIDQKIYPNVNVSEISDDLKHKKIEIFYTPNSLVSAATFEFCTDGNYFSSSKISVDSIDITYNFAQPKIFLSSSGEVSTSLAPNLEFVALNQTKYLIKINEGDSKYILNFNSRRDKKWLLREVDYQTAIGYFMGEKKQYLGGKVTEYERKDKHIITDSIFPYTFPLSSDLTTNLIGNGWTINGKDSRGNKIYLLEYKYQNTFYKIGLISFISLIVIIVLFIFTKYMKQKSNLIS